MPYIPPGTDQYTTPETGIVVTLKNRQSYADQKAVYDTVFGSTIIDGSAASNIKVTLPQAFALSSTKLSRMITAWDLVDATGNPVPVSLSSIEEWLTEKDVTFLIAKLETEKSTN